MAEKESESPSVEALFSAGNQPRFFVELNEPIALFGLNPDGLFIPLVGAVVFGTLSMWTPVLVLFFFGIYLCRRMADNPSILLEIGRRFGRKKFVVPNGSDGFEGVKIVSPEKGVLGCGEWLHHYAKTGGTPQPKVIRKRRY